MTAGPGDTAATIASRMVGVDRNVEMFRLLNNLDASTGVRPGQKYKIVAE